MIDDQFASALDSLKDEVATQLLEEFDEFVKKNEEKFYDPNVNREKRFSLVTPVRRKFAALLQRWRGETARIQEMHTIETVFAEVSAKVDACLAEMGDSVDVSNVESWFNAQWDEVLGDVTGRHKVSRTKIAEETSWTLNHALQRLKSQFRESRCVHKLKALSVQDAVHASAWSIEQRARFADEAARVLRGRAEPRALVVDVMGTEIEDDADDESAMETDTDGETSTWGDAGDGKWEMEIAKVYEMTIVELGATLDGGDAFTVQTSS